MGLLKRCACTDHVRCSHPWHAKFQHGPVKAKVSLAEWWGDTLRNKAQADVAFDALKREVRDGTYNRRGRSELLQKRQAIAADALTVAQVVQRYYDDYAAVALKMDVKTFGWRTARIIEQFGTLPLAALTPERINTWHKELKRPRTIRGALQLPATSTVNRQLAELKRILNKAVEWELLPKLPKIRLEHEDSERERRIGDDELQALIVAAPVWLRAMILVSLGTGIRQGALLSLKIADVDVHRWQLTLRGTVAKGKRTHAISISAPRLQAIFTWAVGTRDACHSVWVNDHGLPVTKTILRKAWEETVLAAHGHALQRITSRKQASSRGALASGSKLQLAQIDLHWHDLRHEFASRHAEAGTPITIIQALLHHRNVTTTQRYIKHTLDRLASAAHVLPVALDFLPEVAGQKLLTA